MKTGILNIGDLDQAYTVVIQIRHQPQGVFHQVTLRPDKVKQTMRQCSMGEFHKSALIMIGETPGDQASGWQLPENINVLTVLGSAHEVEAGKEWQVRTLNA